MSLTKLLRTAQVVAGGREDLRFALHARALTVLGRPWRAEAAGLRAFGIEDPFVIDVGAHRGLSLAGWRLLRPRSSILAFEPNPGLAAALRRRWAGDGRVEVRGHGLGAEPSRFTLHVPVYRGYAFDGLASFDRAAAETWLEGRVYGYDPGRLEVRAHEVEVRRLDDEDLRGRAPFLLKLYIQGHEPEALAGAAGLLEAHRPAILAPSRAPRIDAALAPFGYARFAWQDGRFVRGGEGAHLVWHLTPDKAAMAGAA